MIQLKQVNYRKKNIQKKRKLLLLHVQLLQLFHYKSGMHWRSKAPVVKKWKTLA